MDKQESRVSFSTILVISRLLKKGGPPKRLWNAVTELVLLDMQENGIWVSEEGQKQLKYELLSQIFTVNQAPSLTFVKQRLIWTLKNLFNSGRAFPKPEILFSDISEELGYYSFDEIYISSINIKSYRPQKKTLILKQKFLGLKRWRPGAINKEKLSTKTIKANCKHQNNKQKKTIKKSQKIQNREVRMHKIDLQELLEKLRENLLRELPPIFARKDVEKLLPGVISPRTLENLDSMGKGPKGIGNGKKILYIREEFVNWLINYLLEKNQVVNKW